jgi:hypothetical protein
MSARSAIEPAQGLPVQASEIVDSVLYRPPRGCQYFNVRSAEKLFTGCRRLRRSERLQIEKMSNIPSPYLRTPASKIAPQKCGFFGVPNS